MSTKLGTKFAGLAFAALCAGALMAPAAQATPIVFSNAGTSSSASRFTIGCGSASGSCAGMLAAIDGTSSPLAWSSSFGLMLAGPSDASPADETTFISSLLGLTLAATSGNIPASGNGDSMNFSLDAQYFIVKVGGGRTHQAYAVLENLTGGSLNLFFQATGQAGGLSHYITFGTGTTSVPEPGTLGMLGLGLLIIGIGYRLRRRSA